MKRGQLPKWLDDSLNGCPGARGFFECMERNRDIGFGYMMQLISEYWKSIDPTGAQSVGECYGALEEKEKMEEQISEAMEVMIRLKTIHKLSNIQEKKAGKKATSWEQFLKKVGKDNLGGKK